MRLLILPGMDGTPRLYAPLLSSLPPSLSAKVVEYPPEAPLGYQALLPLVEQAARNMGPFVVVGESFSGPLALMLANRRPTDLCGVVLCASFIRCPLPFPALWRGAARPWMFRLLPQWFLSGMLLGWRGQSAHCRLLRETVRSVSPATLAARANAVTQVDVTTELQTCPVPVIYLRATQDRVVGPGCWKQIQSARPDTQLAIVSGPHLALYATPVEAAATLAAFCDRMAPPWLAQDTLSANAASSSSSSSSS